MSASSGVLIGAVTVSARGRERNRCGYGSRVRSGRGGRPVAPLDGAGARRTYVQCMHEAQPIPVSPAIEVHDLVKVYGEGPAAVRALRGVDLTIDEGEFVAIMGPSG